MSWECLFFCCVFKKRGENCFTKTGTVMLHALLPGWDDSLTDIVGKPSPMAVAPTAT